VRCKPSHESQDIIRTVEQHFEKGIPGGPGDHMQSTVVACSDCTALHRLRD